MIAVVMMNERVTHSDFGGSWHAHSFPWTLRRLQNVGRGKMIRQNL
jgi:hypothetical protein